MKILTFLFLGIAAATCLHAQYAPAAGEPGSTAIHADSSIISAWATTCSVITGYIQINDTTVTDNDSNRPTTGSASEAIGKADGYVVSLGDSGIATVGFEEPISNGAGFDFAIFENGFHAQEPPQNYFLELAFVEVSSDGSHFVRFPNYSETQTTRQLLTYGQIDPVQIHNLAGKYVTNYGTPFDLEDIADSTGIDISNITHVRVIDVIGYLTDAYVSFDSEGRKINDPWPTPFRSCGFDLDAVAVLSHPAVSIFEKTSANFSVYPNPIQHGKTLTILYKHTLNGEITLTTLDGRIVQSAITSPGEKEITMQVNLAAGLYVLQIQSEQKMLAQIIRVFE